MEEALSKHPCYNSDAHRQFARMHLPVAPKCNIQCNYCNRKYDCTNESRPGVTSTVLSPEEAADKVSVVFEKIPELKVIGIAGPGDPMANEATFETIRLIKEKYPDFTLCISTNGLALPENAQRLYDLGVRFVTITMNAMDPEIGSKIYEFVNFDGKAYRGREAAEILLKKQTEGLEKCVALGMLVKINIVMIPGINEDHIPELVEFVKGKGAYSVNVLPLIPVEGTKFEDLTAPTPESRKKLLDQCEKYGINVMRHCKQCRADAIGLLDKDRSSEFTGCGSCSKPTIQISDSRDYIAVATDDRVNVNCGFGNTKEFILYGAGEAHRFVEAVKVDTDVMLSRDSHRNHIHSIVQKLNRAKIVAVSEIGPYPLKLLEDAGVRVIVGKKTIELLFSEIDSGF